MKKPLWRIFVPTVMNNKPVRTRYHKVWDQKVREIAGGLTITKPATGHWVSDDGEIFTERVIPVEIACTKEQVFEIAHMTKEYYKQQKVMFYLVSHEAHII